MFEIEAAFGDVTRGVEEALGAEAHFAGAKFGFGGGGEARGRRKRVMRDA